MTPVHKISVAASEIAVGDRVERRGYLRAVVVVDHIADSVVLTIDRGFGETVTEMYAPTDLVDVWQ